jgi:HEPN domain-containing protein
MSDTDPNPIKTPQIWLQYAHGDLKVAEREINNSEPVYHVVCFLCQGAAEKFLKGFLISHGWELIKTQYVSKLLTYCIEYSIDFTSLIPFGELLNEYITVGRYPGGIAIEAIGLTEAQEALDAARQIRDAVTSRISADKDQAEQE